MQSTRLSLYSRVWWKMTALQFQSQIANARLAAFFFILGKLVRLGFAFVFVFVIVNKAKALAGYSLSQAIFILALFNLVSTITQLFFRGVYMFRQKVINGAFDYYLLNPLSELFYSLFSYTDPLDLLLVIPYTFITVWAWLATGYPLTFFNVCLVLFAILAMELIVFALHVIIISVGIKYLEVDNTIMLYRDLEKMGSFPIEIYGKYFGAFLTYLVPFALMASISAKIIFGLLNPLVLVGFFALALVQVRLALFFWRRALLSYSSASS